MKFKYERVDSLPRLSWCAEITKGSEECTIIHGPWVETRSDFFIEGAWDGPFEDGAIDQTCLLMGSGARIIGQDVVFATPCHVLERFFIFKDNERVVVSPSLAFLLARTGEALDIQHIPYQTDLLQLTFSIKNHIGSIPLTGKKQLLVAHYRNISIDQELNLRIQEKPNPLPFLDYSHYKDYLVSSLAAIFSNAKDPARSHNYRPVATVSSGYDSTACAALANEAGCTDGITFVQARQQDENDSGTQTGKLLGLEMKEFNRDDYKRKTGFPEAEFLAIGDLGQELVMSAFEETLPERMLIIGTHGDAIWDRLAKNVVQDIICETTPGGCLTDFKFRVGFMLVPVAYFGCINHPSIHRISNSPDMAPWTLGNTYDRPIPRRIVEQRGVPRHLFGQKKRQVTVLLITAGKIRQGLKPESLASFMKFYEAHKGQRPLIRQLWYQSIFLLSEMWSFFASKIHGLTSRLGKPVSLPSPIPLKYQENPGMPSFLVHWALHIVQERYAIIAPASNNNSTSLQEPVMKNISGE